jgi:hypothetical protein
MSDSEHVSLREFIERIMDERQSAVNHLADSMEHRLSALNELRADVVRDRDQFVTKAVYDEKHASLYDRISKIENAQSRIIGIGIITMPLCGVLGAIIAHLLKL